MVPESTRRAGPFEGNGIVTSFAFGFKTNAAADLRVVKLALGVETVLVLDSTYTVTLNPDQESSPGGSVTYPISGTLLAADEFLTIISDIAIEQQTDLPNLGAFYPTVIEDALDRAIMLIGQQQEVLDRSITLPASTSGVSKELPTPAAGLAIGWNATADALANVVLPGTITATAFGLTLINAANQATAFVLVNENGGLMRGNLRFELARVNEDRCTFALTAPTLDFDNANGNYGEVTSGGTVTAATLGAGSEMVTKNIGPVAFAQSAGLSLVGGASFTGADGDVATWRGDTFGVKMVGYQKQSGKPLVAHSQMLPLSAICAAGSLSVSLPADQALSFNNGISIVNPTVIIAKLRNGSIIDTVGGVKARIWVAAIYNGGVPEIAMINTWNGTDIYDIHADQLITTVAEGAGAADLPHVWYSETARSNQPMCILGYIEFTQATAGVWLTNPSLVQPYGPGVPLPGQVRQTRRTTSGAVATGATVMPNDDTAPGPQITEGDQFMSLAITPHNALNLLHWRHRGTYANATAATTNVMAYFNTDLHATNAQAVSASVISPGGAGIMTEHGIEYRHLAIVTTATTGKIRCGNAGGTTTTFNGSAGARLHAGLMMSFMEVQEIQR